MQFYVECELIRRRSTPSLHHSRLWYGIECRVHFDQIEMLRVPRQPVAGRQFFRIPTFHETGVRPTGRADKNFPALLFNEIAMWPKTNPFRGPGAFFRFAES